MERCQFLDCFCYVCAHIVPKVDRNKTVLNADFMKVYNEYFPNEMNLSQEQYSPNTLCLMCYTHLLGWSKREKKYLSFITPAIWMEDREGHDSLRYSTVNT